MKSLFVTFCGIPNVGKSTLLNALLEQKISIVTHKAQTTRNNIRGIITDDETQLVLIDTPGLFDPKATLEKKIVSNAHQAIKDAELLCLIIDKRSLSGKAREIIEHYSNRGKKLILIINKIDKMPDAKLLPMLEALYDPEVVEEIFPISAEKGYGIDNLRSYLISRAIEGDWHYPEDDVTDQNFNFLTAEITRKILFENLHQELPYAINVITDEIKYEEEIAVSQTILITRHSHKPIILGVKGRRLAIIREKALYEMRALFQKNVTLTMFVKIDKDWVERWEK